jgi:hypothetical protein
MRRLALAILLLVACTGHADPIGRKYPPPRWQVQRFDGYKVEGLALWQVQGESVPDRNGDRFVVGVDGTGKLVEGFDLFRRAATGQAPEELARRVFDILLAGHGSPLDPARDQPLSMFPKEEWALVKAPAVTGGVLVFWYVQGEMAPQVVRGTLDLQTGALARRRAGDILHPPEAALPGIRAKLSSKSSATVAEGLREVSEWKELAPDVEAVLRFPDASVRMAAVGVLGNLHEPRSVAALVRMLAEGPEWGDRSLAGQALVMRFGSADAIAAVRAHVAGGGSGPEIGVLRDLLKDYDAGKRY